MKLTTKLFLATAVALIFAGCSSRNTDNLQAEMQETSVAYKNGQQGPPAPLTNEDFHYADPACVGEPHLFTLENTEGENLQVQIWDDNISDWDQIFQMNSAPDPTTTFYHTFGDAGTFELRAKIGNGGFTEDFFITVENCDCEDRTETAWADGDRYVNPGNWATYTSYVEGTVTLYAGQTEVAGSVEFSAVNSGMVTITITLAPGWDFQDVAENVKIQDYDDAPSGNPAPGQFAHKANASGNSISVNVPANNYYGIHVDVKICE